MLEPLKQFICDKCGETIKSPRDGWVEWLEQGDDTMYNSDTLSTRHECTKDVFTSSLSFNDWKLYFQNCEWWKIGFYGSPDCTWHDSDGNDYVFDGAKITWSFEQ